MYCHDRRVRRRGNSADGPVNKPCPSPLAGVLHGDFRRVRFRAGLGVPKALQLCQVQLIQCQCGRGLFCRSLRKGKRTAEEASAPIASRSGRSGHAWAWPQRAAAISKGDTSPKAAWSILDAACPNPNVNSPGKITCTMQVTNIRQTFSPLKLTCSM